MTDIEEKIGYVTRHASATCDRFERRFAAAGHEWQCVYSHDLFYVYNGETYIGRVSAEEIVRQGIDALVTRMIAQEETLPFDSNVQDDGYPSIE